MKVHKVQVFFRADQETIISNQKWDGEELSINDVIKYLIELYPDTEIVWIMTKKSRFIIWLQKWLAKHGVKYYSAMLDSDEVRT